MWNGPTAALRLLFEIVVLGAAVVLVFFQPFDDGRIGVYLGVAAGAWVLLVASGSRLRRFKSVAGAVDLVAFNLCLLAVLAEGGLLLAARWSGSPLLALDVDEPARTVRSRKLSQPAGRLRFGFPVNSQSHYDEEFVPGRAGRPVPAMIGDSFSYGVVPHRYHFSTVCERRMGVAVDNFGYPAIGPLEYRHLLRTEVLPLAPDVVAVNVFVGNDVARSVPRPVRYRRLSRWLDRGNLLVYQLPRRLRIMLDEQGAQPRSAPVGMLHGEGAQRRLATVEELTAVYPWLEDPAREPPTVSRDRFLEIEEKRAAAICDPARADFAALFAVLRDMRRLAGKTPLVVQLIPDELQVNDALWKRLRLGLDGRELVRDLPQQVLVPWLEAEGIPYLDLLPVLREQCAPHSRGAGHCYHFRNTHFNARGNRVAGEAMARFLAPMMRP